MEKHSISNTARDAFNPEHITPIYQYGACLCGTHHFYIANGKIWKTNQKVGMRQKEIIDSQDAGLRTHLF
jgi:hypothetical protein